jgi:signal transduction histidine kinase
MKILPQLLKPIKKLSLKFKYTSLQVRLTLAVATISALGLGSVAVWISWQMEHLLIATHKQNIRYIAERFPHDVAIYSDMVSLEMGVQKAIDNLTDNKTLLWVQNPENDIIAESMPIQMGTNDKTIVSLANITPTPELQLINGRYWLLCGTTLKVKNIDLGRVYIAQDITGDRIMFLNLITHLTIATLLAIGIMIMIIAWSVRRSLLPLQKLSQLTATISPERLNDVPIDLENAPSEVRELAQTFEKMLLRLADAWDHQRQLVSNVSHELRTPLSIVSGYLQSTLRRGSNLSPPQREALEIAASEADRTIQLLQDLLDLARAESEQMHFHLQPIKLNQWLNEVMQMTQKYSDRQINFHLSPVSITIKADSNRLKQILLNLIDNAVKYSEPDTPITVKLNQQAKQAVLQISDHGIGIPLPDQARIFERFYRVDEARSRTTGGTGLGLSIVKTLVEAMGGNITLTSQPGKGTTFVVIFPIQ